MKRIWIVLLVLLSLAPALAQSSDAIWNVDYYDNPYLAGDRVHNETVSRLAFNWGVGSPAPNVPEDDFSLRASTRVFLPAGTYRFYLLADHGAALEVDFRPVISNMRDGEGRPGELLTVELILEAGTHHFQVDHRGLGHESYLYFTWADLATNPTGPNFPDPIGIPTEGGPWIVQYFDNTEWRGDPAQTQEVNAIGLDWGFDPPVPGVNRDDFTVRAVADVFFPAGDYRFWVLADDAVRLAIDFDPIIDTLDDPQPDEVISEDVTLEQGFHRISIHLREYSLNAFLYLDYRDLATNPTGPSFPNTGTQPSSGGPWTAEYFNNTNLSGSPIVIQSEPAPSHNWGVSAPFPNMPADNFSARWSTTQYFDGGDYEFRVLADDGVRVYLDGVLQILQWGNYTGQTNIARVRPFIGNHTIVVEYLEAAGVAQIDYNLVQVNRVVTPTPFIQPTPFFPTQPPVQPAVAPTGATATVLAGRLNVRDAPNPFTGEVLVRINRDETYPILGRNSSATWWLVDVFGIQGWVSAPFVRVQNTSRVPVVTDTTAQTPSTGYTLTTTAQLNVRSGPSTQFTQIERIPQGGRVPILGRNTDATWYKIRYNTVEGWVSGAWVRLQFGANLNRIPVLSN